MNHNKVYKNIPFPEEFSVEDWNELIKLKFEKYFSSEEKLNINKELLRTEIINYIQFSEQDEYLKLFDFSFDLFKNSIAINKEDSITELSNSFDEVAATDLKWMTNVLIQPDTTEFEERDKISFAFKMIDEILEGVFKPRFKLLFKFGKFIDIGIFQDPSSLTFGQLIAQAPNIIKTNCQLYLKDPIKLISTNQWRNIAAHKSYKINKDTIEVEYGSRTKTIVIISHAEFYTILNWIKGIYGVIRLSEVLIYLNYTSEIVDSRGGTNGIKVRFQSSLLNIIHNLQVVGFKFVSTQELNETFEISLMEKQNSEIQESVIHASQCLDLLSYAIINDDFTREKYQFAKINIIGNNNEKLASASVNVNDALKRVEGKLLLEEYINLIDFEIIKRA